MGLERLKRLIVGDPLSSGSASASGQERIPKWKALPVLSSDALSSVAYATEEVLIPLAFFATAAMAWSMPIALAIGALLLIITVSYRQTIDAYPMGGGAYTVAKENLGARAGLVAAASLLIDYVMTVAVSVAAGVQNVAAAFPMLDEHRVAFGVLVILLIMMANLRGVRESSNLFVLPTYFFIASVFALIAVAAWRVYTGEAVQAAPIIHEIYPEIPLFLILRSFASGCAALTGVESISYRITVFKDPQQSNAKITMAWMSLILGALFLGLTLIAHLYGVVPHEGDTTFSILSKSVFGDSWAYYGVQASTALILFFAANTAYGDFPRLASMLARDRYLPRQLASLGDRLVFSNGIFGLSVAACGLLIAYQGVTHQLIPLYAVGVFLSFTLSQSGMIMYHLREREPGWGKRLAVNAVGALTTFVVLLVIAFTKFTHGAWMILLLIPLMVWVFQRIQHHYLDVAKQLSQAAAKPGAFEIPGGRRPGTQDIVPISTLKHTAVVPISGVHPGVINALRYAMSISNDVRACYVELDAEAAERMQEQWLKFAPNIPLVFLKSPYRSVIRPVIDYVDDVVETTHDEVITVIIPEFVTSRWYHNFLHNQTAFILRAALRNKKGRVVTSVRYFLK